jgi:hypothetical protein
MAGANKKSRKASAKPRGSKKQKQSESSSSQEQKAQGGSNVGTATVVVQQPASSSGNLGSATLGVQQPSASSGVVSSGVNMVGNTHNRSLFHMRTGLPTTAVPTPVPTVVMVGLQDQSSLGTEDVQQSARNFETCRKKGRMGSDAMLEIDLIAYVRSDLFSKLKFFMDPKQLMFSTTEDSICYVICKDWNLKTDRAAQWWELYKDKIVHTLNCKRADVTAAIKRSFMSK